MRLLAKKPEDRPESAQAVVEAIRAIEQGPSLLAENVRAIPALPRRAAASASSKTGTTEVTPAKASLAPGHSRPTSPPRRSSFFIVAFILLGALGMAGWLFGPAVLRYASDEGELVIEIDDPQVEAVVAQTGVTIHDKTNGRQYKVTPGRHDLKSGDYEIEVTEVGGDLRLFTKEFTITRGGKTPVKVTLAPVALAKKPNPEEKVAEIRRFEGKRRRSGVWPSPPTGSVRCPAARITASGFGTWRAARKSAVWTDTPLSSTAWPSRRTANALSPAVTTKACGCGTWTAAPRFGASRGTAGRSRVWHSLRTASASFPAAGTGPYAFGTWNPGKELQVLKGHTAEVWTTAFLPDGQHALSGGWDHTIRVWDLKEATEIRQLKGDMGVVTSVAVSSDGLHALSGRSRHGALVGPDDGTATPVFFRTGR